MAYVWWYWGNSKDDFKELEVEFTIHNDPGDFSNRHGLYLMVCQGNISGRAFYFGLQTNVQDVNKWAKTRQGADILPLGTKGTCPSPGLQGMRMDGLSLQGTRVIS